MFRDRSSRPRVVSILIINRCKRQASLRACKRNCSIQIERRYWTAELWSDAFTTLHASPFFPLFSTVDPDFFAEYFFFFSFFQSSSLVPSTSIRIFIFNLSARTTLSFSRENSIFVSFFLGRRIIGINGKKVFLRGDGSGQSDLVLETTLAWELPRFSYVNICVTHVVLCNNSDGFWNFPRSKR